MTSSSYSALGREPIRAELFSVERLEQHARTLAEAQEQVRTGGRLRLITRRLADNGDVLLASYRELAPAIREEALLTPAAEWLVDNFHLVERQLHEIRESLPASYYRQLPKLESGHLAGYPRVFGIAWAFVAHLDSRFDADALRRFIEAYQEVQPLTIGELWAIPVTLRLVLIENLRRMAETIATARRLRRCADEVADGLLRVGGGSVAEAQVVLERTAAIGLPQPFTVQLLQRLRDHDPESIPGLKWLLTQLAADGTAADVIVEETQHRQVATNLTVRNIITSLRTISSFEWASFIEGLSLVDRALGVAGAHREMSSGTRGRYRHAIEDLSRGSGASELEVTDATLRLAAAQLEDRREHDPGYFLLGKGRRRLEREVGYRPRVGTVLARLGRRHAQALYVGSIVALTAVALAVPIGAIEDGSPWRWLMAFLAVIPASDIAMTVVNRAVTALTHPKELPSLALRDGPTEDLRTLVAIPAMLSRPEQIRRLVERLEVHFLSGPEGEFYFALLTDWRDSDVPEEPDDEELLEIAERGVAELNLRHGPAPGGTDRFLLLHRQRLFNPGESRFMGWERKRGKLQELNRLLRGARDTSFLPGHGPIPEGVRYVIALDQDSRIPPGAATRLVATMAHPLNRARVDEPLGRVVEGYGVLQPRVTAFLGAGGTSFFQRVFFPPAGIDPYAAAVSDVYQDLFDEGSYAGKGIYDVDAFEAALAGRLPENALLSHDLFEGSFARAGLVSNIEVFEEFPSHYEVALARQHRWVRGDWQLLPWILGRHGKLPPVARLKMVDNLRRSLSPIGGLFTLIASFVIPGVPAWPWTAFVVVSLAAPALLPLFERMIPRRTTTPGAVRLSRWWADAGRVAGRLLLQAAFLAHQAVRTTEAIVLTVWRLTVTRKNLLNWVTAEDTERQFGLERSDFIRRMGPSMVIGFGGAVAAAAVDQEAVVVALVWSGFWVAAPLLAHWASTPVPTRVDDPATDEEREVLRLSGRRTWRFFERFVTEEDNWLPPDNYQEDTGAVAHRTSPTNIGLYLLTVLSAREFGWIGLEETVSRLENTIVTIGHLERYEGHLLNWYDTVTLEPLLPRYVSTVDSGNLAGHLLAVSEGCARLQGLEPGPEVAEGIRDVATLIREAAAGLTLSPQVEFVSSQDLEASLEVLFELLEPPARPAVAGWDEVDAAAETVVDIARTLAAASKSGAELGYWAEALATAVRCHQEDRQRLADPRVRETLRARLAGLAKYTATLARAMNFEFLFNPDNGLLSVGYRVLDSTLDESHYDLLASEARLASFFGIAKGDLPPSHWFRLGRPMTPMGTDAALISWSGSMFEYLMPFLVMRSPPESILDSTYRSVVSRQIDYGRERRVPWGISEAAFAARDVHLTYQYQAFGVPGLGFERGLSEDLVIAPYATMLAAMVEPRKAVANLHQLVELGALGTYGFYESLDFTATRRPENGEFVLVKAFMAHHQAMSLVAVANVLLDGFARRLFHGEPSVQAGELLLHERVPRDVEVARPRAEEVTAAARLVEPRGVVRKVASPHSPVPVPHLLSNGRYSTVVTAAGSGYSIWNGLAVNRWREDTTRDNFGTYLFVKDDTGRTWSAGFQPTLVEPDAYEAAFSEDKVEISRLDGNISTTLTVIISEEDDAEVRRVSLTNTGSTETELEVTSYAELVLAPARTDGAHPAFSNLFIQTEAVVGMDALLANRRTRSESEEEVWAGQVLTISGEAVGGCQYETDRARFLGRGHALHRAAALDRPLSNSVGRVLDPVFSLRRKVRLQPGRTAHLDFTTVMARTRSDALDLLDKYSDPSAFERTATLAWTQAQVRLHHLRIDPEHAHTYQRLAGSLIYFDPGLSLKRRPTRSMSQSTLWRYSISGDLPIVLVRIDQPEDRGLVRDVLKAQEYWRSKGLQADVVVINERPGSYAKDLRDSIEELIRERGRQLGQAPDGGVFILDAPQLDTDDRATLQAVARAVLLSHHGTMSDQLARRATSDARPLTKSKYQPPPPGAASPRIDLEFHNGIGGFAADGTEYVVVMGDEQWSPAPWINVIANSAFGFCVSESGSGYSWAENSRENQLTPWSNDPVSDTPGEVLYVRDEDTGEVWGPTALPIRDRDPYVARHGPGFSEFEHTSRGIALHLRQSVPLDDPVKVSRLRLRNDSGRRRRLSVAAYVEWVLGTTRGVPVMQIVTERDESTGAILVRNPWNADFGERVAFADLGSGDVTVTTDRTEFLGRHGSIDRPAALQGSRRLSGRVGVGFDPCAALQRQVILAPGEEVEVVFLLGQGADEAHARRLVEQYRGVDGDTTRSAIATHWSDVLGTVHVRTPDRSFDLMINHWLLYQALACRVLARAAFYQAGGAYGFRDQLQDVMALAVPMRSMTREHLLRAAAHQFEDGDVLHWWHEPAAKGVRTRISDDYLWLPYAVAHYVEVTGDVGVLDVVVPYLRGPALEPEEDEIYITPETSDVEGTLFDHCRRALDRARGRLGERGLPLIGTGDWNDGLNRVGVEGDGESVWLGWFLDANLRRFADIAETQGKQYLSGEWRTAAAQLRESLEEEAWDGDWYRRAYFDDGTPLGSSSNPECRIDSIAQSWSVIHGGARFERAERAMASVEEYLVHRGDGLVLLFTPPFNDWDVDPGYIKGYLPGVRENGGQYTHAAIWSVIAFATLGDGDRAGELFSILNPINHASTRAGVHRYRVEPYVAAADVYSQPPHVGRGGWTWYTGAAGWMYRAGVEWILGFRLRGTRLVIDPCIPRVWGEFEITFRYHSSRYEIRVSNPDGVARGVAELCLDDTTLRLDSDIELIDDGATHHIRVVMGELPIS